MSGVVELGWGKRRVGEDFGERVAHCDGCQREMLGELEGRTVSRV